jgi:hypothetical protein
MVLASDHVTGATGFHGITAVAELKPAPAGVEYPRLPAFPRHHSRGRIEARPQDRLGMMSPVPRRPQVVNGGAARPHLPLRRVPLAAGPLRPHGIGVDFIRAYEYDKKTPSGTHLAKLVEVLGSELVNGLTGHSQRGQETARAGGSATDN